MYMHNTELNTKLSEFTNHLEDVDIEAARARYVDALPYLTEEDADGSQSS